MRVATIDGLVTLFYDGSKELWNEELHNEWGDAHRELGLNSDRHFEGYDIESLDLSEECKEYTRERLSWQQVIVVDGVTRIPDSFLDCWNIKRVIIADTVISIARYAFFGCHSLVYIKLSINLLFIGESAFEICDLSSVFIPPQCVLIGDEAFAGNENLTILNVPQDTELNDYLIHSTKLIQSCPNEESEDINTWLKNVNNHENFALHRVCASFEPTLEMIVDTMNERGGPNAFKVKNTIGVTPSRYLKENPYTKVTEKEIIEKYTLQMMGEYENM